MSDTNLLTESRTTLGSRPAGRTRRTGRVPAVVYGQGEDSLHVTVDAHTLTRILASETGANTLITLQLDGVDQLALARQIQRHPVRGNVIHVDFIRVRADEEVQAEVPLHLLGEAAGVRGGGILDQVLFNVTVMARPTDLPPSIDVDITDLDIGGQLRVDGLEPPPGVTITVEPETLVASIVVPSEIEEEEPEELEGEELEGELAEGEEAPEGEASEEAESSDETE